MILAIDTSAAQCAVALAGAGEPVAERLAMERGHAEHLFPMIESVLATAGCHYDDLSRIAVCTGPGSFTGVRIGVAAARGLALGRGIPVIGISRFEVLAAETGWPVAICLAGRGGAVYLQVFGADGTALAPPRMVEGRALAEAVPPGCDRAAGDAAHLLTGAAALLPQGLPDPAVLARLAADRAPGPLPAPLYLRGADAELPREGPPALLD
ncbi:MAG TPA: tRNA (adenosine(37)-N6)-threonylcarbamoyltransferase complex dimerization subunit type 1 TsaB [Thermohalobaculum sp.]|nr:tRNA (adenosine(37)-N6)-threonylcarbamoyltransferase complex dimerization subunit type 1 TsaB [Thermohalobaculum sp.]